MGVSFVLLFALTTWLNRKGPPSSVASIPGDVARQRTGSEPARRRDGATKLFSQLSQKQIAANIRRRYLAPLLQEAGLDTKTASVEKLSDLGFANNVYIVKPGQDDVHDKNHALVAKIFSDLAKKRVHPKQEFMGEIDELLHHHGIGPNVVAHTSDGLLMEYIEGEVLTDSIIFEPDTGLAICQAVGDKLGHMHTLEGKGGPNMLWRALDVLLSSIDDKFEMESESGATWTLAKLEDTIGECRNRLESLKAPCVPMGHGDFKLSNVMITSATKEICFIDFELTGTHYRGYDLAKFFRSSKESIPPPLRLKHQKVFWESYHNRVAGRNYGDSDKTMAEAVSQLEWEAELLEPMTWLEAAAFFLSMANLDDPSQKKRWNGLAINRLTSFEGTKVDATR